MAYQADVAGRCPGKVSSSVLTHHLLCSKSKRVPVKVIVIEIAQIDAVEVHSARERIVEPLDNVRDCRLSAAYTQTLL